jgi:hypothetical protein
MVDLINSLGFVGAASFVGCWLVVVAIIGRLIALSHILQRDVVLQYVYQRVLVGLVGIVFLVPGLHALYFGRSARTVAPMAPEYVAPGDSASRTSLQTLSLKPSGSTLSMRSLEYHPARLGFGLTTLALIQGPRSCNKVESFGLYANSIRRLKYQAFRGRVYVYVGSVSSPRHGSTEVYLFSTDASAPADGKIDDPTFQRLWTEGAPLHQRVSIQGPGDSVTFPFNGAQYKLTVMHIYKALLGADEIVVEVCAL